MKTSAMILLVLTAHVAAAQTVVRVEAGGLPVPGAEVTAWDTEGRLAFAKTTGLGTVRLNLERKVTPAVFLLVRHLGYAPVRVAYTAGDSLTVVLTPVPVSLPVLTIDAKSVKCPARNEPAADSVWRAMAAHYTIGASRLNIVWTGGRTEETVTADQRGYGDGSELRSAVGGAYSSSRGEWDMGSQPSYAQYERHINLTGEFWRWRYASIGSYSAEHFVTESFHERHAMVMLGQSAGATIIGFCPRNRSEADIEGEMQIGPDTLLRSARWFFKLPHDDEDAGGESVFTQASFNGGSYLVAIRGTSWRRAGKNLYNQDRFERLSWKLSQPNGAKDTRAIP